MAQVEQAVFTSARTDRSAGYQLVGRSPGVCEADARQLAVWGPSHDALLELGAEAGSINFHPLPSGAYCVSRTSAAGWEYSGRGGHRVYTQCLIVPPHVLERFSNNPFAVVRAAVASGAMRVFDRVPHRLEPVRLVGTALPVDQELLAKLAGNPGPQAMAALVQAARDAECLAVASPLPADTLLAGLISCLPPECRRRFPLSTGLKFSSRRPLRLVALSGDRTEQLWVAHQCNLTVIDLADSQSLDNLPLDGWSQWIRHVLAGRRISFLSRQLSKRRFDLTLEDLPALGLQLLEQLEASELHIEGDVKPAMDLTHAQVSSASRAARQPALAPDRTEPSPPAEHPDHAAELDSSWPDEVPGEGFVDRPILEMSGHGQPTEDQCSEPDLPPDARALIEGWPAEPPGPDLGEDAVSRKDQGPGSEADSGPEAPGGAVDQPQATPVGVQADLSNDQAVDGQPDFHHPSNSRDGGTELLSAEESPAEVLPADGPAGVWHSSAAGQRRAHAAHAPAAGRASACEVARPSARLAPDSPEVLGRLEQLDDVVYEALDGQATALEELETLWPEVLSELGDELVAESREQYLRYALQIWERTVGPDGLRKPGKAAQALDVLCVLFGEF